MDFVCLQRHLVSYAGWLTGQSVRTLVLWRRSRSVAKSANLGWQMTTTYYRDKIEQLLEKMVRSKVHPANRVIVDEYLDETWHPVTELVESFAAEQPTETFWARFQPYIKSEEERLEKKLESLHYHIDASDTLTLVLGPGRIEKV